MGFQPTRPLRGATIYTVAPICKALDFNPRAPCGARRLPQTKHRVLGQFQPTRPLRGATVSRFCSCVYLPISTHAPLAGRDYRSEVLSMYIGISTHAPLAGRDRWGSDPRHTGSHFNPRAPCGARPWQVGLSKKFINFNPRAPCGARLEKSRLMYYNFNFNPRAPCGARPVLSYPL